LISIPDQTRALAGRFFLWLLQENTAGNPLRELLQYYVKQMSLQKWGTKDYTWIFAKGHPRGVQGSKVWQNMCANWKVLKERLVPKLPDNSKEWEELPIWRPHILHNSQKLASCLNNAQRQIRRRGFTRTKDVLRPNGEPISWSDAEAKGVPRSSRRGFEKMMGNLNLHPTTGEKRRRKIPVYMQEEGTLTIWEFQEPANTTTRNWWMEQGPREPVRQYRLVQGFLEKVEAVVNPGVATQMRRILVGKQKCSNRRLANKVKYGDYYGSMYVATQYQWEDSVDFFDTNTGHLRMLQGRKQRRIHKTLLRWNEYFVEPIDFKRVWAETWVSFRSAKENCFLWQMVYRIPATQHWRFPTIPRIDSSVHCTRCRRNQVEDILHCMWSCPKSGKIWRWIAKLLQSASGARNAPVQLQFQHVFFAAELDDSNKVPANLWRVLRAAACWVLWTSRCKHFMVNQKASVLRVKQQIWSRLGVYLKKSWKARIIKIQKKKLTSDEAKEDMEADFGSNLDIWYTHECRLVVPPVPPRPP
jgi:hypothetical protein